MKVLLFAIGGYFVCTNSQTNLSSCRDIYIFDPLYVLKRCIDVAVKRDERLVLVAQGDVERDLRRVY